jgi:hypothetical protein
MRLTLLLINHKDLGILVESCGVGGFLGRALLYSLLPSERSAVSMV